jgi:hypothetical protein
MPDAYIIEVEGRTAGIVARDSRDDAFGFFAAVHTFDALEGQRFADPLAAETAARRIVRQGPARRPTEPGSQ